MRLHKILLIATALLSTASIACSKHDHHAAGCPCVCPSVEHIQEVGFDNVFNPAAAQKTMWAASELKNNYGSHHGNWSFVLKTFSAKDAADAKVQAKNLAASLKFVQMQRLPNHQLICVYKTNQDQAIGMAISPAAKIK